MSVVINQAAWSALMKEQFGPVSRALFEDQPTYALLDKDESVGGTDRKYPIETQATQGFATSFQDSMDAQTAGAQYAWLMTLRTTYSTAEIDAVTWRRAMGNESSFVPLLSDTTMKAMKTHQLELGSAIFLDSSGVLGQASSTISGAGVVTLANPDNIFRFYKDMKLEASANYGGPAVLAQTAYIVGINYNNGTFQLSNTYRGTPGQPTGWSGSGLYFNRFGCLNTMISGLSAWIPETAPVNTDPLFYGVPRWEDSKLYGVFQPAANGRDNTSAFIQLAGKVSSLNGKPKLGVCTYKSWTAIKDTFQGTIPYEPVGTAAGISFPSLALWTEGGKINIVPDNKCNPKTGWLLDPRTISFISNGAPTGPLEYPGNPAPYFIRPNSDAIQVRTGGDTNLIVMVPGHNGRTSLTT